MFNLIKNNVIQFDKLIIEQYYKLNIDEVDTIILIRLHDLLMNNINVLNEDDIAKSMKINKKEMGNRIVRLVKNGFVTLELSNKDNKEIFSLDETYKRLGLLLSNESQKVENTILKNNIKDTVNLLERELKKILSPLEREMVTRWYVEDEYTDSEIEEAILQSLKYKNRGVAYIDRLLQTTRRDKAKASETKSTNVANNNIQELFNKYYARSK